MQTTQSAIIILLVANLAATIWFGLNEKSVHTPNAAEKAAVHGLPAFITPEIRRDLLDEFIMKFNNAEYDALYDMFGPAAKAQFTKERAEEEFVKLSTHFHSVTSGAYTHSELAGTQGSTNFYILHYAVKLSEQSTFGTTGKLKITIATQSNEYQLYGIHMTAGTE